MGRIPHETIQRIHDTADIVDVISDFVSLKKSGANYTGLCPFHDDKTPSFSVSPSKEIFKCFSCGKGGNLINFVMEIEGLSYVEAMKYLAEKYNIQIEEEEETEEQRAQKDDRESMLIVSAFATGYFQHALYHTEEGRKIGLSYFHERGFRDDIIQKFQLGYNPDRQRAFTDSALKKGYKQNYLEKTGLTVNKNNFVFDRFRGRVMFPIQSLTGKTLGFGGRILKNDAKTAKYLNSPESEIYNKSRILYGIYQAKQAISKQNKCFLVEGYTDVLAFHQAGIEHVVASSGTALTEQQIRLIKRLTEHITLVFDGDEAGLRASTRGINLILAEGMRVKTIMLPEGEDPDSFAKARNASELQAYINENERDFIDFKAELLARNSANDPVKRAEAITDIVRSIAAVPNEITQSIYIQNCHKKLDVREDKLYSELGKIKYREKEKAWKRQKAKARQAEAQPRHPKTSNEPAHHTLEEELVKALLRYHDQEFVLTNDNGEREQWNVAEFIFNEMLSDELHIQNPVLASIFNQALEQFNQDGTVNPQAFIKHEDPRITQIAADFISSPYTLSKFWQTNGNIINNKELDLNKGIPALMLSFKSERLDAMITEITKKIAGAETDEQQAELLQHLQRLKNVQIHLSHKMGGRILARGTM